MLIKRFGRGINVQKSSKKHDVYTLTCSVNAMEWHAAKFFSSFIRLGWRLYYFARTLLSTGKYERSLQCTLNVLISEELPGPSWFNALWWSLRSFMTFNVDAVESEMAGGNGAADLDGKPKKPNGDGNA